MANPEDYKKLRKMAIEASLMTGILTPLVFVPIFAILFSSGNSPFRVSAGFSAEILKSPLSTVALTTVLTILIATSLSSATESNPEDGELEEGGKLRRELLQRFALAIVAIYVIFISMVVGSLVSYEIDGGLRGVWRVLELDGKAGAHIVVNVAIGLIMCGILSILYVRTDVQKLLEKSEKIKAEKEAIGYLLEQGAVENKRCLKNYECNFRSPESNVGALRKTAITVFIFFYFYVGLRGSSWNLQLRQGSFSPVVGIVILSVLVLFILIALQYAVIMLNVYISLSGAAGGWVIKGKRWYEVMRTYNSSGRSDSSPFLIFSHLLTIMCVLISVWLALVIFESNIVHPAVAVTIGLIVAVLTISVPIVMRKEILAVGPRNFDKESGRYVIPKIPRLIYGKWVILENSQRVWNVSINSVRDTVNYH